MNRHLLFISTLVVPLLFTSLSAEISVTGNFFPNASRDPNFWVNGGSSSQNGAVGGGADGTLRVDNGSVLNLRDGIFGNNGNTGTVTVTDSGSELIINRDLFAGRRTAGSTGILTILNGGTLKTIEESTLGVESGANGSVLIEGSGSSWNASSGVLVGDAGNGTLTLQNMGTLQASSLTLGRGTTSSGVLRVEGTGVSNQTRVTLSNDLTASANSDVLITNGGRLSSDFMFIQGNFVVEDSQTSLAATTRLALGSLNSSAPDATMTVQHGAQVSTEELFIGRNSGGRGDLTLQGNGTRWTNNVRAFIGGNDGPDTGTGVLHILDGARFQTFRAIIGEDGSVSGQVMLRAAGSTFLATENALIDRKGTVSIHEGGSFRADRDITVNENGSMNLFLDGSTMVQAGRTNNSAFGDYINNGTTNLFASGATFTAGHRPIVVGRDRSIGGNGTYNAIGGSYDQSTGIFTASDITTDRSGALGGKRIQFGGQLIVSFADSVGDVNFDVTRTLPNDIDDRFLMAAYSFDTELTDTPTGLSFQLFANVTSDDLSFWYRADGSTIWEAYDPSLTTIQGNYATMIITQFGEYAVTSSTFIPDPVTIFRDTYGLAPDGSEDNDDWSANGIRNIFYHVFGLGDPSSSQIDESRLPSITAEQSEVTFRFLRPVDLGPLHVEGVSGQDLSIWDPISDLQGTLAPTETTTEIFDTSFEEVTYTFSITDGARFWTVRSQVEND